MPTSIPQPTHVAVELRKLNIDDRLAWIEHLLTSRGTKSYEVVLDFVDSVDTATEDPKPVSLAMQHGEKVVGSGRNLTP